MFGNHNYAFLHFYEKRAAQRIMQCGLLMLLWAAVDGWPAQNKNSAQGVWEGAFIAPGTALICTAAFHINNTAADSEATISAPGETPVSVPVRVSELPGSHFIFILQGAGQYEGILAPDGKTLQGKLRLGSMNIPLDLKLLIRSMPDIKAITKWMRKHAVPFKTVEPQSGGEDLAALKKIIGNARIAAIGEATHGTHEFFKMKHRIFKYLVEQMGFTVFALEANMPEARAVNNYVLNGSGDPKTALQNLYSWPWKTEELLDMIEWMHAYNANPDHLRKVKFYGYDMQVANRAMSNVMEFLQRADPEYAAHAEEVLSAVPLTEQEREHFPKEPDANSRTVENIEDVLAHIDSMSHDGEEWREARQDALVMQQAVRMLLAGDQRNTLRDEAMAANAAWILEQEGDGAKMMIWAHNDHVRTTMADGKTWMGGHLRKRFDKELITMGFAFNQGAFLAKEAGKEPQEFHEPPAMPGTLDAVLAGTKIPLFALDLRAVDKKSVMEWVRSPQKTREMGSVYFGDKSVWQIEQSPVEAFDVLLFVESTTPTRLLSFSTKIPQPDLQ